MGEGRRDERTLKMMEEYIPLFNSGMTAKKIAAEFGLSSWTVYHYVGEIAEAAGVPRESLLNRPHASPTNWNYVPEPVSQVSLTSFKEHHQEALKSVGNMIANIETQINLQQEQVELEEKEQLAW